MADTPQAPKKTLSIGGGTLSVGASSAPRSGGSVSVEVRRRQGSMQPGDWDDLWSLI